MKRFEQKVIEKLGYYVYALIDPRDDKIFYIGKGNGDRVFQHCLAAINGDDATPKFDTIREIHNSGLKVRHYILRHRLSEEVALQMESLLIDFLTYTEFNTEHVLTNIQGGYHQWDEGIKTV
ncbi:MAG TPA: GIY-YIG nuclease family protein, partial [Methanocorpusculum sp.]|nr:GIY-YIG nuclease family protein [Methanocorpusculum sp.]